KHFAECLLKCLAISPESLIVVSLPQRKGHERYLPAPRHGGIRGSVIKRRLLMAHIVLGTALEERLAQHRQNFCRRFGSPLGGALEKSVRIGRNVAGDLRLRHHVGGREG